MNVWVSMDVNRFVLTHQEVTTVNVTPDITC